MQSQIKNEFRMLLVYLTKYFRAKRHLRLLQSRKTPDNKTHLELNAERRL